MLLTHKCVDHSVVKGEAAEEKKTDKTRIRNENVTRLKLKLSVLSYHRRSLFTSSELNLSDDVDISPTLQLVLVRKLF